MILERGSDVWDPTAAGATRGHALDTGRAGEGEMVADWTYYDRLGGGEQHPSTEREEEIREAHDRRAATETQMQGG